MISIYSQWNLLWKSTKENPDLLTMMTIGMRQRMVCGTTIMMMNLRRGNGIRRFLRKRDIPNLTCLRFLNMNLSQSLNPLHQHQHNLLNQFNNNSLHHNSNNNLNLLLNSNNSQGLVECWEVLEIC